MQYIPTQTLPNPLAGFSEAAGTLADAVIQSRERQALTQDYGLLAQALAQFQPSPGAPGGGGATGGGEGGGAPAPDPQALFKDTIDKMRTPQGKLAAVKMMMEYAPTPLYGYKDGQLVQKGTMPARGQIVKPDPEALEEKKQEGREKIEIMRQEQRDQQEAAREASRERLAALRDQSWQKHDQRRYDLATDLLDKRLDFQTRLQDAKTEKDRTEMSRKELVNVTQRAKENYNKRLINIRKEFEFSPDPAKQTAAMEQAGQEHRQDLDMVYDAYKDVIDKYGIKLPGMKQGAGQDQVLAALPDAAAYPGKVARDTVTGKRFKSDGKQWRPLE